MGSMTPEAFIAKWKDSTLKERWACRKVCERAEKWADWLGLQAGLPSYSRSEMRPPGPFHNHCDRNRLAVVEFGRLAELTQDRDAIDPTFKEKVGHAVQGRFVNPAILVEGGRGDQDDSLDPTWQDQGLPPLDLSRPAMVGQMLAIRPPSTRMTDPVTYEARLLARNVTTSAYSSG
jgi:hypothetical protein